MRQLPFVLTSFVVMEDYSDYETADEAEPETKTAPPKKKAKTSEKDSKTDTEMSTSTDGGETSKPKPKPRASLPTGKSGAKPKGQASVASFFKKKE